MKNRRCPRNCKRIVRLNTPLKASFWEGQSEHQSASQETCRKQGKKTANGGFGGVFRVHFARDVLGIH